MNTVSVFQAPQREREGERERKIEKERGSGREKEREWERERVGERKRERERESGRKKERERVGERESGREKEREREKVRERKRKVFKSCDEHIGEKLTFSRHLWFCVYATRALYTPTPHIYIYIYIYIYPIHLALCYNSKLVNNHVHVCVIKCNIVKKSQAYIGVVNNCRLCLEGKKLRSRTRWKQINKQNKWIVIKVQTY